MTASFYREAGYRNAARFAGSMEDILFTPRTRVVVAKEYALSAVAPTHDGRKGARLGRSSFSGLRRQMLG